MKLAVMQPYFFPYIGYFQLINAVDKFVMYDDVTFIKQGWINRNRILVKGSSFYFTVPLSNQSSNQPIRDTKIHQDQFAIFKRKFLKQISQEYKAAINFNAVFGLISNLLEKDFVYINEICLSSIRHVCDYLGVETDIVNSSKFYSNSQLQSQERIMDICKIENADEYLNLSGGIELYQKDLFNENGIDLKFIRSKEIQYKQFDNEFVPWLSIIDVMMFNEVEAINKMLDDYELL